MSKKDKILKKLKESWEEAGKGNFIPAIWKMDTKKFIKYFPNACNPFSSAGLALKDFKEKK